MVVAILVLNLSITSLARGQSSLHVISSLPESESAQLFEEFKKYSGIQIEVKFLPPPAALRWLKSGDTTFVASVWLGGTEEFFNEADKFDILRKASVDNISEAGSSARWKKLYARAIAFAYDNDVLNHYALLAPFRWSDILEPRYAGRLGFSSPLSSDAGYASLLAIKQLYKEKFNVAVEALLGNLFLTNRAGTSCVRQLELKEIAVCIAFADDIRARMKESSGYLFSFPLEGTTVQLGGVAVLKNAPENDLADRFVEWLAKDDSQLIFAKWGKVPINSLKFSPNNEEASMPKRLFRYNNEDRPSDAYNILSVWQQYCDVLC